MPPGAGGVLRRDVVEEPATMRGGDPRPSSVGGVAALTRTRPIVEPCGGRG
jgi:hypothetical protein